MPHWDYIDGTREVGGLIVQVVADTSGSGDPRDADNLTEIFGEHRNYIIGEGKPPSGHMRILERGGLALLYRYMRRFGDPRDGSKVLAFKKLCMMDHSGISFWTADIGASPYHWSDSAGWDSGSVGYVIVTQKRWDWLMGEGQDPFEPVDGEMQFPLGKVPVTMQRVYKYLDDEVEEYSDYVQGNVWGYVITKPCKDEHHDGESLEWIAACPHSEIVSSVWGFVGDPKYAWEEALADVGAGVTA